jgi:hypothetical protein
MKALFCYSPNVEYSADEIELEQLILREGEIIQQTAELVKSLQNQGCNWREKSTVLKYKNYFLFLDEAESVVLSS